MSTYRHNPNDKKRERVRIAVLSILAVVVVVDGLVWLAWPSR
jgi:hypothetical protein